MQRNTDEKYATYDAFFVNTPLCPKSTLHSTFLYLVNKLYSTLSVDFKSQFTISRKKKRQEKKTSVTSLAQNVFWKSAYFLLPFLDQIHIHEHSNHKDTEKEQKYK